MSGAGSSRQLAAPAGRPSAAAALGRASSFQGGGGDGKSVNDYLREEAAAAGRPVETLRIGGDAARHVAAYLEYERIVGDADGGRLLSEAEYAAFKQRAAEARETCLSRVSRFSAIGAVGAHSSLFCAFFVRAFAGEEGSAVRDVALHLHRHGLQERWPQLQVLLRAHVQAGVPLFLPIVFVCV